jgi:hypothetical protein
MVGSIAKGVIRIESSIGKLLTCFVPESESDNALLTGKLGAQRVIFPVQLLVRAAVKLAQIFKYCFC